MNGKRKDKVLETEEDEVDELRVFSVNGNTKPQNFENKMSNWGFLKVYNSALYSFCLNENHMSIKTSKIIWLFLQEAI